MFIEPLNLGNVIATAGLSVGLVIALAGLSTLFVIPWIVGGRSGSTHNKRP